MSNVKHHLVFAAAELVSHSTVLQNFFSLLSVCVTSAKLQFSDAEGMI